MTDIGKPQFVDTNVLVYAHDKSAGHKHDCAVSLLKDLWASGLGRLSIQVLQEFHVAITQKVAKPISPERAADVVQDLSTWCIHRPRVTDILEAIRLQGDYRISFWDAMVLTSAIQLGCDVVWSEDMHSGQSYGPVTVRSPF